MRTSTKVLILIWMLIGLPLAYLVNSWATTWWSPFDIPKNEDASYYVAWAINFGLIYLLPAYLLIRALIYLRRRILS